MPLKHNGYWFGVLLGYAVTTITLPSVGWCARTGHTSRPDPGPALLHERAGVFTTGGLALSGAERPQLDFRPPEESGGLPSSFHNLENWDGTRSENETSTLTPKLTVASTSRDQSFETRNKPKRSDPPNEDCGQGRIERLIPGRFYITGQLERNPHVGYQAHSAASVQPPGGPKRIRGQQLSGSEEIWHRLQPVVLCGHDAMTLTVRRRRAVQLQLDRVNESSVPLSQLPPQCGYSVQATWRDLSLMARYDACHVTREDDRYVLRLLWRGTPVQMSCPAPQIQPQATDPSSLCCSPHGMTFKVHGLHATEELRVNVRGEWTPLLELAEQCGYRLERQDADIIIAAPFITCGVTVKDGKYTLSLQIGEKTFTLACPVSPHEELPLTHQPVFNRPHLTTGPAEHMPESLHPFPWAPPFYLAPPYYPHPTHHHKYPSPDEHTADIPPTPSSSTPGPTFGPHPLPAVDSQPHYQNYYSYPIPVMESYTHGSLSSTDEAQDSGLAYPDPSASPVPGVSKRHSAARSLSSDTGLPIQVEAPPPLQPPSHAFSPYYHYYHHPKIPLPGPPQDSYPGPGVPREVSLTNPNNPDDLVFPHNMQQQSEALRRMNSHQFLQPVPQAASHPHTVPTSPPKASALYTPHPAEPYPNYYSYYFPHIAQGEAIRLASLNPDTAANLPDHQNSKSNAFVHSLPCPSQVHDGYHLNTDKKTVFQKNRPEGIKPPLLSELNVDLKAELDARVAAVQPPLSPTYPPGPAAVAEPPPDQPSFTTPPPNHHLPPYPYYYHPYYLHQMYYGPEGLLGAYNSVSSTSSKEAVEHLPRESSSPTRHPSYPNHQTATPPTKQMYDVYNDPLHPYYYYNTLQYLYDAFGRPGGEKAEKKLDNEMKDQLRAEPPTPSASPWGLGPASYFDCSVSLGCCSYPVKDCTMGQHLIFAMPHSVAAPALAPPAHPSARSNVSCTLQKLTPDLYAVPLDGCGVSKHVFGQTVVHQLEVHGILSQQDHRSEQENSPIRLMVECSSFLGFPGEVRLHVMDQPPPPPPVPSPPAMGTVLLRIATDESFTSFHPEAHLPLSLMRGRPVYVEVSLLDPPEPGLVLLVHYCLAFTHAPYASWMLVYDGCPSRSESELLPSPRSNPDHIRRFTVSGFLSLHSASPSYMAEGGYSHLWDPEIYFLCLTELCSATDSDCTAGCIHGPNTGTLAMK